MSEPTTCLRCRGHRVVEGTLGGKTGSGFFPHETKAFRISLDSPAISINRRESFLCMECGLVWSTAADMRKALYRIMNWGTDELKSRLGMEPAAVVRSEKSETESDGESGQGEPDARD